MSEQPLNVNHTAPEDADIAPAALSEAAQLSQWNLMLLRFRRNHLAMVGVWGLVILYVMIALAPFLSPNDFAYQNLDYIYGRPNPITLVGPDGGVSLRPYTHPVVTELDPEAFKFVYVVDESTHLPLQFMVRGDPYKLLGLFESDVHFVGIEEPHRLYIFGADKLGRDVFARVLHGGQVSMTVGLLGVAMSIILGSILGTMSGYFGGFLDDIIQRIIELIMSFPTVPLWAALAAALPPISSDFTVVHRFFLITVILSLVNWTGLARQVRAKVMAYHESDFVQASLAAGASHSRIIFVHMLPNAASHIIVVAALAVPGMILGETALSFLGLGILPPAVSWGALLKDAQQVIVIIQYPWLILPGAAVVLGVLFFSFLGDGVRDAIDPYSI